jgi:hypothetical protein
VRSAFAAGFVAEAGGARAAALAAARAAADDAGPDAPAAVCLDGPPGSGRSALLAHLATQLSEDLATQLSEEGAGEGGGGGGGGAVGARVVVYVHKPPGEAWADTLDALAWELRFQLRGTPPPLPTVAPTRVPNVISLSLPPPSLLLPLPVSLLYTPSVDSS